MRKRLCAALLALLLVWLCVGMAFAADVPTVIYNGASGTFTFRTTDGNGLLSDFQDVMPGDNRTTEIRVEMKQLSRTARLYLRAEPDSGDTAALEPLTLQVRQNGVLLNEGSGTSSLSRDVLLGTFSESGSTSLEVTLTVPVTVGNELARKAGELRWIFTVQEDGGGTHPSDPVDPVTPPTTGDPGIVLYCAMTVIAGTGLAVLCRKKALPCDAGKRSERL